MSVSVPQLLDLRTQPNPKLLAAFIELYTRTFTDPSEREDPAQWPARLYGDLAAPQPQMHLVAAVDADTLCGGIAFEYYRESRCGLLTYLVVDPAYRRRGLAHQLIQRAITLLKQDATDAATVLRGVFSETENPDLVDDQGNAMSPRERLMALARLGARQIDIPYVQPALEGGKGRCHHLLLLAFYPDPARADMIEGSVVRDFLHEFYRALGVVQPEADAEFQTMDGYLQGALPLEAL